MPHSNAPSSASQKFDWESASISACRCIISSLPIALHRPNGSSLGGPANDSITISAAEREALDDAIHHFRLIQVQHLGYPASDGELTQEAFSFAGAERT